MNQVKNNQVSNNSVDNDKVEYSSSYPQKFAGENIWLIGASSGIGRALAINLASQGANLALSSRREQELDNLKAEMHNPQSHLIIPLDVSDEQQVFSAAEEISNNFTKIDRVIFMAATYKPNDISQMDIDFTKNLIDINLMGALYVTYAVMPILNRQNCGQFVLCSSVAAYTGLPGGQPYSATKAAITNFAESLYAENKNNNIDIKIISPGFVRTRITDKNKFHMPMIIEPEQAAEAIAKGLLKRSFEINFPKRFTYMVKFLRLLPYPIKLYITKKLSGSNDNN